MPRVGAARIGLAVLLAMLGLGLSAPLTQAQEPSPLGVELRLAGRVLADGSVEVGLQHRFSGRWRPVLPTRRVMSADAPVDAWRAASPVSVPIRQMLVRISTQSRPWDREDGPGEFAVEINGDDLRTDCRALEIELQDADVSLGVRSEDCEEWSRVAASDFGEPSGEGRQVVRILARRVGGGGVELGLQRRVDDRWDRVVQVDNPLLPPNPTVDRWYFTPSLDLPAPRPNVMAELRRGATIETVGAELRLTVDGNALTSRCGFLALDTITNTILVDSYDRKCAERVALATICSASNASEDCDRQRNLAYEWERRQLGRAFADDIEVTRADAQAVVDAIHGDYVRTRRSPSITFASDQPHGHYSRTENQIVLGTDVRILGAVIHELAHALVDHAGVRDPGHGPEFTAMLLQIWSTHFPLVDVDTARFDAESAGIEIAERAALAPIAEAGPSAVRGVFCTGAASRSALCEAFTGQMSALTEGAAGGAYIGTGVSGDFWWRASIDQETGMLRSYIVEESVESSDGQSVARLKIDCNTDDELEMRIWWRGVAELPATLAHRFGDGAWHQGYWHVSGGSWGDDDEWSFHGASDADSFLHTMSWYVNSGIPLVVRYERDERTYMASFGLRGVFDTPVQPNLARCGAERELVSPDVPVIDGGRYGDDFWWGASIDQETGMLRSHIVKESVESSDGQSVARLKIDCNTDDELEVRIWWRGVAELPATLAHRFGDGAWHQGYWHVSGGSWGDDDEWSFHGAPDADSFLHTMSWYANSGIPLVVRYDRDGRAYTASFGLRGVLDTPVQPNFARCGAERELVNPDVPVVGGGRYGDDFWWGASEDGDGDVRTYVVRETSVDGAAGEIVRMQVRCYDGELAVGFWWDVDPELDQTVRFKVGAGEFTEEEWASRSARWGEDDFKWLAAAEPLALAAQLAWAAQAGEGLSIHTHARNNNARVFAAVFDLDGLFETPVQPNLARCGH